MNDLEIRLRAADFGTVPEFNPPDDLVDVGLAWMDSPIGRLLGHHRRGSGDRSAICLGTISPMTSEM